MAEGRLSWRVAAFAVTLVALAGVVAVAPPGIGPAGAAACPSPYAPAGWRIGYSTYESSPGFVLPTGTRTAMTTAIVPEYVSTGQPTLEVDLPGGTVSLSHPGADLLGLAVGDLDGDGIPEWWVGGFDPSLVEDPSTPLPDPIEGWVVPGDTPPGSQDPAAVGIEVAIGVPWAMQFPSLAPDFDWDDDGHDDLLLFRGAGSAAVTSFVVDGLAVMAFGPGGDASGLTPLYSVPGTMLGVVVVPGQGQVAVTTPSVSTSEPGVVWLNGPGGQVALSTAPLNWYRYRSVDVVDSGTDGLFLVASVSERNYVSVIVWRLDDPCGGLPVAAPPSGAAEAVAVAPAITG